jgi:hypothetical protein
MICHEHHVHDANCDFHTTEAKLRALRERRTATATCTCPASLREAGEHSRACYLAATSQAELTAAAAPPSAARQARADADRLAAAMGIVSQAEELLAAATSRIARVRDLHVEPLADSDRDELAGAAAELAEASSRVSSARERLAALLAVVRRRWGSP